MHIPPYPKFFDMSQIDPSALPHPGTVSFVPLPPMMILDDPLALSSFASEFESDDLPEGVRVEQEGDSVITILVDVVGRGKDQINVYTEEGVLFVHADPSPRLAKTVDVLEDRSRMGDVVDFEWELDDHWTVRSVECENGVVEVVIERIVPESLRRRDYLTVPTVENDASA